MVINQPCFTRNHSESKSYEESHHSIIKWTCWLECNEARKQLFDQRLHQFFYEMLACLSPNIHGVAVRECKQLLIFYIRSGSVIQRREVVWQSSQFCIACRWIFIVAAVQVFTSSSYFWFVFHFWCGPGHVPGPGPVHAPGPGLGHVPDPGPGHVPQQICVSFWETFKHWILSQYCDCLC